MRGNVQEPIFQPLQQPKHQRHNLSASFNKIKTSGHKFVSVELCPERNLNVETLQEISPGFCSVTWRSPSDTQLNDVSKLSSICLSKQLSLHGYHVLLHLTGRQLTKHQAVDILTELRRINVRNIFVLQGEPSQHGDKPDFKYASDLIAFIKENFGDYFYIGVAAYPDTHPLSAHKFDDLKYLKIKVEAGADFIITQMIFNFESFNSFLFDCKEAGINVPIIPGISVINSYESLNQMAKFCRVAIPEDLEIILRNNMNNPEAVRNYGVFHCNRLVRQILLLNDVQVVGVHFFSLNNVKLVKQICKTLGLCDVYIERPLAVEYK